MKMRYTLLVIILISVVILSMSISSTSQSVDNKYEQARLRMVEIQIERRGIRDESVLRAMRSVPRHLFVPSNLIRSAYTDQPLPIGHNQTISQPYIVAYMTEALHLKKEDKVLEIGTGSGYQAAVLAEIADSVYTIEIVEPLAKSAQKKLDKLGYKNIFCKAGDGYLGWPEAAPFDAIIITAAPPRIPTPLIEQLKEGGRMILPVGEWYQELVLITKRDGKITKKKLLPVRFVPMTGEIQNQENTK
ncbi:protein-L-isoaspartate(D-aspartate) O-methyltransferase [bacterium]|nr:protein-L-isoaspartate(D-aspartate) O-methyltransferase [bacterium]